MEVNKYQLYFNTAQRSSGTPQHAYFGCKPSFTKKSPLNWFEIQITSAEIPYQWTQINESNSTLDWSYTRASVTVNGSLVIQNGNYDVNNLITELFYELSLFLPPYIWTNNSYFNPPNNKIIFSIIGTDSIATTLTLKFSQNLFLGTMFGCTVDTAFGYSALNISANNQSNTSINVNPVSSIYIRSSLLKQLATDCGNSQENMVAGSTQDISDIVNKIQILTPPYTYVYWINQVGVKTKISNPNIDQIDVYLSDNRSFDLNITQDWTFALAIYEYAPLIKNDLVDKHSGNLFDTNILRPELTTQTEPVPVEEEIIEEPVKTKRFQR